MFLFFCFLIACGLVHGLVFFINKKENSRKIVLKSREEKDDAKMEKKSIQVPLRLKPILLLNSLVPFHYTDSSNPIDNWDMIFWVFSTSWQLGY